MGCWRVRRASAVSARSTAQKGVVRRGGVMIDQDGDGMGGETFCDGLDVGAGEGLDAAAAEFDAGGPDLDGFWLHSESAFGIAERG